MNSKRAHDRKMARLRDAGIYEVLADAARALADAVIREKRARERVDAASDAKAGALLSEMHAAGKALGDARSECFSIVAGVFYVEMRPTESGEALRERASELMRARAAEATAALERSEALLRTGRS